MKFLKLFFREPALLGFGLLFCFFSSVGQTYIVSVFVPAWSDALALSEASIANIYGGATIAAAALLSWAGRFIDRIDLTAYGAGVCLFTAAGCFLIAGSPGVIVFAAALTMVRLGGQGLMTHVAMTGIARFFDRERGRALSLTMLGLAFGAAVLPLLFVSVIASAGWRAAYAGAGAAILLVLAPAMLLLVRGRPDFRKPPPREESEEGQAPPPRVFRTPYFLMIAPLYVAGPLLVTALVFLQSVIAEAKGMTLATFASAFALFAMMQVIGSLAAGPVIDRFTAHRTFSLHLAPFALGVLALILSPTLGGLIAYMALLGFSTGLSGPMHTAIIAELVRPSRLGAARSAMTAVMVLSTAVGPALFGWLMLAGISVDGLLWLSLAAILAVSLAGALAEYGRLVTRPDPDAALSRAAASR